MTFISVKDTMVKTPAVEKVRKSTKTPKTMPSKKLSGSPKMEQKSLSVSRRGKLDFDTVNVTSICTPSRTTRSMAKVTSNDMPPPAFPFSATPSKRKTIASTSSAKKSLAQNGDVSDFGNGSLVRSRRYKAMNLTNNVEESIVISDSADEREVSVKSRKSKAKNNTDESDDGQNEKIQKRAQRKSKRAKVVKSGDEIGTDESNDEGFASVSQLGMNTTGRSRKSKLSITSNSDLLSVPEGKRLSARKSNQNTEVANDSDNQQIQNRGSGKFVRPLKQGDDEQIESDAVESNDEGLASVSQLGMNTTGRSRKSKLSISSNGGLSPAPQKRLSARKSNQGSEVTVQSNGLSVDNEPGKNRESGKFVRPRKSNEGTELANGLENPPQQKRKSGRKSQVESNEGKIENVMEVDESEIEDTKEKVSSATNGAADSSHKDIEECPKIVVMDFDEKPNAESKIEQNSSAKKEKSSKDRFSIIDLTESPQVPSNTSVLNVTFTDEDDKDKTSAVNDKTFSPIPSSSAIKPAQKKQQPSTPATVKSHVSFNTKSTGKKKSPPLKRLQSTPFLKPKIHNSLNTSAKLSSAKKAKVAEAAIELIESTKVNKTVEKVKGARVTIESPKSKVFKFGADNQQQNPMFRFSMVSEHLQKNEPIGKTYLHHVNPVLRLNVIFFHLFNRKIEC